jgi:hypothetical protein
MAPLKTKNALRLIELSSETVALLARQAECLKYDSSLDWHGKRGNSCSA